MRRCLWLAIALLAALPAGAAAKGDVRARIEGAVRCDARPGTSIVVRWSLRSVDANGRSEPFGAGGVYVKLVGARSHTAGGRSRRTGRFTARVRVPRGGIRRIEIALQGWRSAGGRTERADKRFPVENDPCR